MSYLEAYNKYHYQFSNPIVKEPILEPENSRYCTYPIKYTEIWQNYKNQLINHWIVEEIDLSNDNYDWNNCLNPDQRYFLKHILAIFASFDGIINVNMKENIFNYITIKEAECAYGKQFDMENIHGEMYSLMIETFITNQEEKNLMFDSVNSYPSVAKKVKWCEKWIKSDYPFIHKIIAFSIVEGIFFSGSFASIFWINFIFNDKLSGLRKSNGFIARDESQHVELATLIVKELKNKLKQEHVYEILSEAVEIEDEFIVDSLPCRLVGINALEMSKYIRYVADRLLVQLGYEKLYNESNPFEFMNKIDNFAKSSFFEERNNVYSDSKIINSSPFEICNDF
jgi:ribonucleoside-diphosphate reductase subunit M2